MTPPDSPLYRFKAEVQAIQQAYVNVMAWRWGQVTAGELSEADYWAIANGGLLSDCGAMIAAATTRYQATATAGGAR